MSVLPLWFVPSSIHFPNKGDVAILLQVHADPSVACLGQPGGMFPIASKVPSPTLHGNKGVVELSLDEELLYLQFYGVLLDCPLWES